MSDRWVFLLIQAVPCSYYCKHCLFAPSKHFKAMSGSNVIGAIQPFVDFLQNAQSPYQHIAVHVGDCALNLDDFPTVVRFLKEHNIEGWKSIASDGFRRRTWQSWMSYLQELRQAGTEILEFSLYGRHRTHDWFAGVKGSYKAIHSLAELWHRVDGKTLWGIFVHKRNLTEVSKLCFELRERYGAECSVATWSFLGWGVQIENLRIEKRDLEQLDSLLVNNLGELKTEREWMDELCRSDVSPFPETPRVIRLAIDPAGQVRIPYTAVGSGLNGLLCGNMSSMSVADIMEQWQRTYQTWLDVYPAVGHLCHKYGDARNERLYDRQSVIRKWCAAFEAEVNA